MHPPRQGVLRTRGAHDAASRPGAPFAGRAPPAFHALLWCPLCRLRGAVRRGCAVAQELCFYGAYHQDPVNQGIHFVFVPTIWWSICTWLCYVPLPMTGGSATWGLVSPPNPPPRFLRRPAPGPNRASP